MGDNKQTTQSSQQQNTQPWAPTIPGLQNLIGSITSLPTSVTGAQQQAGSNLVSAAQGLPNMGPTAMAAVNNLYSTNNGIPQEGIWNQAYSNLQKTLSPYLNSEYLNPFNTPGFSDALGTMNQDITNQIKGMYAASGRDPTGAGNFAQSLARGLSQGEGNLIREQFNSNVGAQQGAANSVYGAGAGTAQGTAQLGQIPLMDQVAALQQTGQLPSYYMAPAEMEQQAATQQYQTPFSNITAAEGNLLPIAGLGQQGTMQGTSTTSTPTNWASTLLGAGLGLASLGTGGGATLGGSFLAGLSDERAKEDIEPVGILNNGLNVYKFRYKGEKTPQIGLMAQEVEKVNPDAVIDVPVGGAWGTVKFVNYDKATRPSEDSIWAKAA